LVELLLDDAFLLRFHKKYNNNAIEHIIKNFDWRLSIDAATLSFDKLTNDSQALIKQGLFRFHRSDLHNRPVAYIKAGVYTVQEYTTESLCNSLIFCFEILSRSIHATNIRSGFIYQAVLVIDLQSFGLNNVVNYF
jgi:hypothetical protein